MEWNTESLAFVRYTLYGSKGEAHTGPGQVVDRGENRGSFFCFCLILLKYSVRIRSDVGLSQIVVFAILEQERAEMGKELCVLVEQVV